ncbi:MAG: DUF4339 domain-containing protein [Opitutae bacterium]
MQIHVARGSSSLGVFSIEEVVSGLQSGRFSMTDLAWREGMSTWVMLAQWSEFAGVLPAAPPDVVPQSNNLSITVPWEKSRSIGSYFETIKGALLSPYATFASGTFGFKQYIAFAYITALLLAPFSIFGQLCTNDINQNIAEFLSSIDSVKFADAIHQLENTTTPPVSAWLGVVCYTLFYPFFIALFGVFLWLGLKLFRESVTLEKTVVALIISLSALNLCSALILLTAPYKIYFFLVFLSAIPSIVISCRCTAAVLKVSPFKVFGVWFIGGLVSCCCVCACGAGLAALVGVK